MVWSCDTVCSPDGLSKRLEQKIHQPLKFLQNRFAARKTRWNIFEQGDFAFYKWFQRLIDKLVFNQRIVKFNEHKNLPVVFHLLSTEPVSDCNKTF